jgi:hypothetical protein
MPCTKFETRLAKVIRVEEGEKIHYVDVIILYLYTCKYSKFPIRHPKVYVGANSTSD